MIMYKTYRKPLQRAEANTDSLTIAIAVGTVWRIHIYLANVRKDGCSTASLMLNLCIVNFLGFQFVKLNAKLKLVITL